jgi:hypothetical protein
MALVTRDSRVSSGSTSGKGISCIGKAAMNLSRDSVSMGELCIGLYVAPMGARCRYAGNNK